MADVVETVMPKVQGVVQNIRRRFGTTSKREKGKSSPGFLADKKSEGGSPPPVGEDNKLGYGGRVQDARKARPKEPADKKSPLLRQVGHVERRSGEVELPEVGRSPSTLPYDLCHRRCNPPPASRILPSAAHFHPYRLPSRSVLPLTAYKS